jgi:hypothetical protein
MSLLVRAVARPLGPRQGSALLRRWVSVAATPASRLPIVRLPTKDDAASMPRHVSELSGEQLFTLAEATGHQGAVRERMRREIMAVDDVPYTQTGDKLIEMSEACKVNHTMIKAPYLASIYIALVSGWASIPLVFTFPVAQAFNDRFVTADTPEVGEADTWLEVRAPALARRDSRAAPSSSSPPAVLALTRRGLARVAGGRVVVELDGAAARHHLLLPPVYTVRT